MIPIISSRPDGLGTRLLSILHGLRFAEQTGASFSIGWPSLDDCNYPRDRHLLQANTAGELFNLDQPIQGRNDVLVVDRSYWHGRRCCILHGALSHITGSELRSIEDFCSSYEVMIYDLPVPVLVAGSLPTTENRIAKRNWARLNFAQPVKDVFNSFASECRLSSSVAVHIRRGDIINILCRGSIEHLVQRGGTQLFQRYVSIKSVVTVLQSSLSESVPIIVCSEDGSAAEELAELLPRATVHSSFGLFPPDSNQAALLDMMLLAQSRWLVSPFKSYFSECATVVGKCQPLNVGLDVVNVVNDLIRILNNSDAENKNARRAVVYAMGYLNLWHQPDSAYRHELRCLAQAADPTTADAVIGSQ